MLSGRETRTCHKELIEISIYPVDQMLTRHTEGRIQHSRDKKTVSTVCSWLRFAISWRRSAEEGKRGFRKTEHGGTNRKRSLDRLAFGRRNFETGSENRRKWLDFFHGRRIRGRVERQIEFGRSFCRPARFNSRQTSRWVRGDEGECEISVDRHEKLGTRFLRSEGCSLMIVPPQNNSPISTISGNKSERHMLKCYST